jgi:hypothetical protein
MGSGIRQVQLQLQMIGHGGTGLLEGAHIVGA